MLMSFPALISAQIQLSEKKMQSSKLKNFIISDFEQNAQKFNISSLTYWKLLQKAIEIY